jgi:hypothetical protein
MRGQRLETWWQSDWLLMLVGLLFPGLGLMAIALWPQVHRRRKIYLIARCVGLILVFAVAHLVVGSLDEDGGTDRLLISFAATAVIWLLITTLPQRVRFPFAPPGPMITGPEPLADFVVDQLLFLRSKRLMVQIASSDMPAWRTGYGLAHWYFEGDIPEEVLTEGMETEEIASLGATFCFATFVLLLEDRGEAVTNDRLAVFTMAFTWTLRHLIDDQLRKPAAKRSKEVERSRWWAI